MLKFMFRTLQMIIKPDIIDTIYLVFEATCSQAERLGVVAHLAMTTAKVHGPFGVFIVLGTAPVGVVAATVTEGIIATCISTICKVKDCRENITACVTNASQRGGPVFILKYIAVQLFQGIAAKFCRSSFCRFLFYFSLLYLRPKLPIV